MLWLSTQRGEWLAEVRIAGVRARQQGLPFVTVDDADLIAQSVKPLVGQQVQLISSAAGVTLQPHSSSEAASEDSSRSSTASQSSPTSPSEGPTVTKVLHAPCPFSFRIAP